MCKRKSKESGRKIIMVAIIMAIAYSLFGEIGLALVALFMLLTAS